MDVAPGPAELLLLFEVLRCFKATLIRFIENVRTWAKDLRRGGGRSD